MRLPPPTLGVLLAVALLTGACADDQQAQLPPQPPATLAPDTAGDVCDDPVGDLSSDVGAASGTVGEPAGADLVHAEADLGDDALTVTFEANGDVDAVPDPLFVVAQGDSGRDVSFELRAVKGATGAWGVQLVTYRGGEQRTQLDVPVTVDGSTLRYEVPRQSLPTVATLLWQFGAASGTGPDAVFDDCSPFTQERPTTTTAPGPPATTPPRAAIGTTQVHPVNGARVTVHAVEPAGDDSSVTVVPTEGTTLIVVDAEVCAEAQDLVDVSAGSFFVRSGDGGVYPVFQTAARPVREPVYPSTGDLAVGSCQRGWIPYQIRTDTPPVAVSYVPDTGVEAAVEWAVP